MRILFILAMAFSAISWADESFVCTNGESQRIVEIVYMSDQQVPCEVRYTKGDTVQTLWVAENQIGYCEEKAAAFIEKQEGWGWTCEGSPTSGDPASEQCNRHPKVNPKKNLLECSPIARVAIDVARGMYLAVRVKVGQIGHFSNC